MSRIDDLIAELCPAGVEHMTLGELFGKIPRGKRLTKSSLAAEGTFPVFHGGLEPIGFHDRANSPGKTVMIINTGASSGTVGWSEIDFWCSDGCFALPQSERVIARFLYYFTVANQKHFVGRVRRAGIPTLAADAVLSMRVPVPPLEVQRAIVEVLDTFSKLEAELEAELEARKQQYEHYLRTMTDPFEVGKQLKTGWTAAKVGQTCSLEKGVTPIQKAIPGNYPLVVTAADRRSSSTYQFDEAAACVPLVSSKGHGVASISNVYFQDGKFALGNILCAITPTNPTELSAEFLSYFLHARKDFLLVPLMRGGANVSLTVDSLRKVQVHFPPRDEQDRIVRALRVMKNLWDDQNFGLPAELAARRQQYEYYRDKLLTFKELEVAA